MTYLVIKKLASKPKCGDCGLALQGIPCVRPRKLATLSRTQKNVTRAYGGSRCATCVRSRSVYHTFTPVWAP